MDSADMDSAEKQVYLSTLKSCMDLLQKSKELIVQLAEERDELRKNIDYLVNGFPKEGNY